MADGGSPYHAIACSFVYESEPPGAGVDVRG